MSSPLPRQGGQPEPDAAETAPAAPAAPAAETAPAAPARCPHCRRLLVTCSSCNGHYDQGRLCQHCMFGVVCPACTRHWTWN